LLDIQFPIFKTKAFGIVHCSNMAAKIERASTYTAGSGDADARNGEPKRNLWTSMLESVASGKRLPEKNLLILGRLSSYAALSLYHPRS
jgi:hypothetical protein